MVRLLPLVLALAVLPAVSMAGESLSGSAGSPTNLFANAGFEAGGDRPDGWHLGMEGRGAGSATWEAKTAHSGARCVRVELTEHGDYWMADQVLAEGTAGEDGLYRLCGWYRASEPSVAHPTVYSLNQAGGFLGAFEFSLPATDEWRFFDTVFRPREGADHFRVQLRVQGSPGAVWYDDVSLSEVSDAAGFIAYHESLAEKLRADAASLEDWWSAIVPTEGGVEFRLRGAHGVRAAIKVRGQVEPSSDAFVGAELEYKAAGKTSRVSIPFMPTPETAEMPEGEPVDRRLDLAELAPDDWDGTAILRLCAHGLGPSARVLAALEATREARQALVEAYLSNLYESPAGEPLPWAAAFVGDAESELARLAARNLSRHLRGVLGVGDERPGVCAVDGLSKRRPDQWRDDLLSGDLKAADEVRLLCAGAETESFQCLFVPAAASPGKLTAEMTPLRAPAGAVLPSEACKVHLVEYVPFAGRWWPDPLLEAQPFEPSEWGPAVFWVTVSIPEGQRPGLYRGELVMRAERGGKARAVVRVRVPEFSLTRETHLNSSFWLFRAQIRRYFDLPDEPSPEAYGRYIDLATSHRLSPIDVLEGPCSPLVTVCREADGTLTYDWSRWDAYLTRAIDGGANTIHAAWTHWMGQYFSDRRPVAAIDRATGEKVSIGPPHNSDEHLRYLGEYIRAATEHVRSLGFDGVVYVQPYDEPSPEKCEEVARTLVGLGRHAPDVPRLMDAVYPPALPDELRRNIDLWCPLSPGILDNEFEREQAGGDIIWWYVCCGPRGQYANFFTNQSVIENRMLFCQTWQHKVTGVLYWGLNYWISWGAEVPEPRFPRGPWYSSTSNEHANYHGDGYFIYPGATVDAPLSSIRLETLRDGVEDYEYLALLAELSRDRDVPAEAERLLAVPPEISPSLTGYTRDPDTFRRYRARLAEWIERLGRG
jgi:hypothetical protein